MFKFKTPKKTPPFGSIPEVADYTGYARVTIYRWITHGKLPATKFGAHYRIKWADVDALIAAGTTVAPTD